MGLGSTGKPLNFTGKPPTRSNQSRNGLSHNAPARKLGQHQDYLRYLIFILTRKACNARVTPFASIIGQECR